MNSDVNVNLMKIKTKRMSILESGESESENTKKKKKKKKNKSNEFKYSTCISFCVCQSAAVVAALLATGGTLFCETSQRETTPACYTQAQIVGQAKSNDKNCSGTNCSGSFWFACAGLACRRILHFLSHGAAGFAQPLVPPFCLFVCLFVFLLSYEFYRVQ